MNEEEVFFKKIQDQYKIKDERFYKGLEFAQMMAEGEMSATKAFAQIFEVDTATAKSKASKLKHSKWVQELIRYYMFDDSIEYTKETRDTIKVLHAIVQDPNASNRERTEASKALREYIKAEQKQIQKSEEQVVSETISMIGNLVQGIKQLSASNKMIDKHGTIIDVSLMD